MKKSARGDYQVIFGTPNWILSGVNIRTANLARGLLQKGVDTQIVLTEADTARVKQKAPLMPLPEDIPVHHLPVAHDSDWGDHWIAMLDYLEECAPCVYLPGFDWRHSCISPLLSNKVIIVGDVASDHPAHYDHVERLGQYWNSIVVVSEAIRKEIAKQIPGAKHKITKIPVGVPLPEEEPWRSKPKEGPLRLIYHGALVQQPKRIFDLIEIMERLQRKQIPFTATIVGSGADEDAFRQASRRLIEAGHLKMLGLLSHTETLRRLAEHDVFLLPSEYEGFPNALLEAMAHGLIPLVSNIRSGIPEVIRNGKNGYRIDIGDIDGYVEHLEALYNENHTRMKLARAAHKTIAAGPYNSSAMVEKYDKLFSRLVKEALKGAFQRARGTFSPPPQEVAGFSILPGSYGSAVRKVVSHMENRKVIMVMGVQRSGTTILMNTLTQGDDLPTAYHENEHNDIFEKYFLKPETEIRGVLDSKPYPIFLKPISETKRRTIEEVLDEFRDYDLRIIGVYRDPVNVFYSSVQQNWFETNTGTINYFSHNWNTRNLRLLEGQSKYPNRVVIVKYEDMIMDPEVWEALRDLIGIQGKYLFKPDSNGGRENFPIDVIDLIDSGTEDIRDLLNEARTFRPGVYQPSASPPDQTTIQEKFNQHVAPPHLDWGKQSPDKYAGLALWLDAKKLATKDKNTWQLKTHKNKLSIHPKGKVTIEGKAFNNLPAIKIENDGNEQSYLELSSETDWGFLFDGSGFMIFAIFKPIANTNSKSVAPIISTPQTYSGGPGFGLQWSQKEQASTAIFLPESAQPFQTITESVIHCPYSSNSHLENAWGLSVYSHNQRKDHLNLYIFQNNRFIRGGTIKYDAEYPSPVSPINKLYIGSAPDRHDLGFSGHIAELIIYKDRLNNFQRLNVTEYLKEKYSL